ncbi:hypothetical protein ACFQMF_04180 [Halorubrum rutilum]|uniref:PGF-CTERM sorting domain-containing protein n=1 Tax=Halorubrum rutilum TaxID=1364933 RepID=A0ABD6AIU4_9EURY|nr:hypothetical protein [Halorubrum rutilum]
MIPDTTPSNRALRTALCLALCLSLVGAGVGTGPATAQAAPAIDVMIGGESFTDNSEITVMTDPTANVTVSSNGTIDLIEIRVNGVIRHSYHPNSQSFNRSIALDLDPNKNTVEVIARGAEVASSETTVIKHTAAPWVRYSSPFSTSVVGGPPNETNVSGGQVTLAGTLHTASDVEWIWIERTHFKYASNQSIPTERNVYRLPKPGDSFSQDLLLANGTNRIVARYADSTGRIRKDSFRLIVDDVTDPTITLHAPNESYTDSVRVRGTVRDETKLHRVTLSRTSNGASQVLLAGDEPGPEPERLTYDVNTTIDLYDTNEDNEFRLVAEDSSGNVENQTFSVAYDPTPRVTVTENVTNVTAKTVHVAGNVSEAQIRRVTLESIDTRSGERLDIARVYEADAPPATTVDLNHTLTAVPGKTAVNLIIAYEHGQYSRSITPAVSTPPESADEEATDTSAADGAGSDRNEDRSGSDDESSGNASMVTGDGDTPVTGDENPLDRAGPVFVPIRTREALGGVAVVGATYLLGHRI